MVTESTARHSFGKLDQDLFFSSLFYLQNTALVAWVTRIAETYNSRTLRAVEEYLTTLASYVKAAGLGTSQIAVPFTPKIWSSEESRFDDVLFDGVGYNLFKRSEERQGRRVPSYVSCILEQVIDKVTNKKNQDLERVRNTLRQSKARRRFEEFLERCTPPRTVVIVPIAGFESAMGKAVDYYRDLANLNDRSS